MCGTFAEQASTFAIPADFMIENPNQSIPLLYNIKGPKGYRSKLKKAAQELYRLMYESEDLRAKEGVVKKAGRDDSYSLPKVPAMTKRPNPDDIKSLIHLLHSLAHILSHPSALRDKTQRRFHYVAVPMDRSKYAKGTNLENISATSMRGMIAALCSFQISGDLASCLFLVPSHYNVKTGKSKGSRVHPSGGFSDWLMQQGLVFYPHPNGPKRHKSKASEGLLWMKWDAQDGDDSAWAEPLSRDPKGDEQILPELNKKLKAQKLTFPLKDYKEFKDHWDYKKNSTRLVFQGNRELHRQFSENEGWGGRLYGHYVQLLPSEVRKKMMIDGEPVVESDYSSMQLRLLYASAGKSLPSMSDLYIHPKYEQTEGDSREHHRDQMKMVLTHSVGCRTRDETVWSLQHKLRKMGTKKAEEAAQRNYDLFWSMHEDVCPHDAEEAAWTWLQRVESDIALRVLSKLMDQGIAAIPVHDSFIVKGRFEGQLDQAMKEAFDEVMLEENNPYNVHDTPITHDM